MKKVVALAVFAISVFFTAQLVAHDAGYITTIPNAIPAKSILQVNLEAVDGKEPGLGVNTSVKPGTHQVKVSLVFNSMWGGTSLDMTNQKIYYANIDVDVEAGKTYFLGAEVDLNATPESVAEATFWRPVVYRVE
jgi:hypothetical protein